MHNKKIASVLVCFALIATLFAVVPFSASAATQPQIDAAAVKGLTWLAGQQSPDGSWGTEYLVSTTSFAVLKFETHALHQGKYPLDPAYQYSTQVKNGLNYVLSLGQTDGSKVWWPQDNEGNIYHTSLALMAIVSSCEPNRVVSGGNLDGMTYKEVAQGVVDFLASAQVTTSGSPFEGGWSYMSGRGDADQSNSGYATLALAYAEAPTYKFACTIPASVRTHLQAWVTTIQDPLSGASHYRPDWAWPNTLKTGSLLQQMAWLSIPQTDARVQKAVRYIADNWNDPIIDIYSPGWNGNPAAYQAAFCMMKGFESYGITTIKTSADVEINWFDDVSTVLVAQQNLDGSWPNSLWDYDAPSTLSTAWSLLTLERAAPPPPTALDGVKTPDKLTYEIGNTIVSTVTITNPVTNPAVKNVQLTDVDTSWFTITTPMPLSFGDIAPGASVTKQIEAKAVAEGTGITNKVSFSGTSDEGATYTGSTISSAFDITKPKVITVPIDIQPGDSVSAMNMDSKGVTPVAILSTSTFEATKVDTTTVKFGPTGTETTVVKSSVQDVNGDGMPDIMVWFVTKDAGFATAGLTKGVLSGQTTDTPPITFQGSDDVKIILK